MINHKCVSCGMVYEHAAEELLSGCICGSKLFYFVKSSQASGKGKKNKEDNIIDDGQFLYECDDESNEIIIFDIESISVKGNGKYDINLDSLMNNQGLIYKYDDGKYSIDLDKNMKFLRNK